MIYRYVKGWTAGSVVPILDALLVAQAADEEDAVVLRDDDILEALDDHLLARRDADHATLALDDLDLVAHDGIALLVLWQEAVQ